MDEVPSKGQYVTTGNIKRMEKTADRNLAAAGPGERIRADVCVVGGGIAGLTCARALAFAGADVVLVEKGRAGAGAAHVAAGMLAPLVEARLEEREVVGFGRDALEYWPGFVRMLEAEAQMPIDYRTEGTLVVGVERDHIAAIRHLHQEQRELGLPVERLSGYECRKLEPYLSPAVPEGIFSPGDHQIDNRLLLSALVRSCRDAHGVRLLEECGPVVVERQDSKDWRVSAGTAQVTAPVIVAAAGSSLSLLENVAPELLRLVRPVKGQIVRLDQSAMPVLEHVVRTPEMYMAPKSDGTLVLGASSEDRGFDPSITLGPLFELFRAAWECVPAVYELPVIETAVGFRPASIDHAPLLGETRHRGLYLATGYYRHGILFAPLAGELLARKILEESADERIERFSPNRFGEAEAERYND